MNRSIVFLLLMVFLGLAPSADAGTTAIVGATVIDATGAPPKVNAVVLIKDNKILGVGRKGEVKIPSDAEIIDASGKYVIPGLMEGINLLWFAPSVQNLIKYDGRYDEVMLEAAQIGLKNGMTGGFATWFYYPWTKKTREVIRTGKAPGARVYVGGNIIGFDGPFSPDGPVARMSEEAAKYVDSGFAKRLNEEWEQGTGRRLMSMTPEAVRSVIREYLRTQDLDYVKYAVNGHSSQGGVPDSMFITFSPRVQRIIVEESHRAGLTVQAHTMTVEGMDMALDAGVDIITHGEVTGPTPIPEETLRKMVERKVAVGVFPMTRKNKAFAVKGEPGEFQKTFEQNLRSMIKAGIPLMLGTESMIKAPGEDVAWFGAAEGSPEPSFHATLGDAHFYALQALEEEGMPAMEILKTATSNIGRAYKLPKGTLEPGKLADIIILDANPLESALNYRKIHAIMMDGRIVDRDALPTAPVLTQKASVQSHSKQ